MATQSNPDKILALLALRNGLDDDEISVLANITPRQTVNQICRRLTGMGVLERRPGPKGKLANYLVAHNGATAPLVATPPKPSAAKPNRSPTFTRHNCNAQTAHPWVPDDPANTLYIIPCSGAKDTVTIAPSQREGVIDHLSSELREHLLAARAEMAAQSGLNEQRLLPAWKRYAGSLYQTARQTLERAVRQQRHVVILSGGYGVLSATEPIGCYDAAFHPKNWPAGLLANVLLDYARRHQIKHVRAFASASTGYRKIVEEADWRSIGIDDACLFLPIGINGGAMVKTPRAQGEALTALLAGNLDEHWTSSDGATLQAVFL